MEKAIEIKRRAQRCIQNNDLDGALQEYEKLVNSEESDPYNFVLLADLLFKKGEPAEAADRYLSAVNAYEKASLYKNAIAVCKKMLRLSLTPAKVLQALAHLHALDGLAGESSLYHVQYAEYMVRANKPGEAAHALRQAFDVCQDNVKVLEQLAEAYLLAGENVLASATLVEAAGHYRSRSLEADAQRLNDRAHTLDPEALDRALAIPPATATTAPAATPAVEIPAASAELEVEKHMSETAAWSPDTKTMDVEQTTQALPAMSEPLALERMDGLDSGRHYNAPPRLSDDFERTPEASQPDVAAEESQPASVDLPAGADPRAAGMSVSDGREEELAEPPLDAIADEPETAPPVYEIEDESGVISPAVAVITESPEAPGLTFGTPVSVELESSPEEMGMANVEHLLAKAQEQFRSGNREEASVTLAQAAQAYEAIGRFDSAVTIYRSLGRGAHSTPAVMELWLMNCEAREDRVEAAQVACEIGDAALNRNETEIATSWFERAASLDPSNELARRRLQRLSGPSLPEPGSVAQMAPAPAPESAYEGGRVEVAVGRGEAVTFDLSGLLAEFQRGVASQLAGDAQSHYDLGMTYREMGLLEQAVDSFRVAEQDPRLTARSLEMIGRCFEDQGRYAEAATEYRRAIDVPGVSTDSLPELRMQLAKSLAGNGDAAEAEAELARIDAAIAADPDLAQRVDELRRSLGRS